MDIQEMADALLASIHDRYDEKEGLVTVVNEKWVGGYHTRKKGLVHNIRDSVEYGAALLLLEKEEYYGRAFRIFDRVCGLQDLDSASATYGLWSYFLEEDLRTMLAPDYNWSDFIGKNLIGALILKGELLPCQLREKMVRAVRAAMECSVKRNVAPDYTNMSIMGAMTIISAGELLSDEQLFKEGKNRLTRLCEYTRLTGTFTEYNSSAYVLVAIHEIDRMRLFFKDLQCREMAEYLNTVAWRMLAKHFNLAILQLAPPQARAYRDLENGSLAFAVWQGTGGRYGYVPKLDGICLEALCFPPSCPESQLSWFVEGERWFAETYYKKNNLRTCREDLTIIRETDSPDRVAWSYMTESYSMGAFRICDCWSQRRNCMVVWDRELPKYFRLRALDGNYDFCSAMVYICQHKNRMLGQLGLVTDRGSFHYILDKRKDGVYETEFLGYRFELGGNCDDVQVSRRGNTFVYEDENLCIELTICQWVWDGKEGEVRLDPDKKSVVLVGYEGEKRQVNTAAFQETFGVFTLEVREKNGHEGKEERGASPLWNIKKEEHILASQLPDGEKMLRVVSNAAPISYREAVELASGAE